MPAVFTCPAACHFTIQARPQLHRESCYCSEESECCRPASRPLAGPGAAADVATEGCTHADKRSLLKYSTKCAPSHVPNDGYAAKRPVTAAASCLQRRQWRGWGQSAGWGLMLATACALARAAPRNSTASCQSENAPVAASVLCADRVFLRCLRGIPGGRPLPFGWHWRPAQRLLFPNSANRQSSSHTQWHSATAELAKRPSLLGRRGAAPTASSQ